MVKKLVGAWAFLIGVLLTVVLAIFGPWIGYSAKSGIIGLLIIAGILVGLLNIGHKNSSKFLLAGLALVIVSFMGRDVISVLGTITFLNMGMIMRDILTYLLVLFVPATIIVALKSVFEIAHG